VLGESLETAPERAAGTRRIIDEVLDDHDLFRI
jgi:hypothetical protein